jgi:hypothetical protein
MKAYYDPPDIPNVTWLIIVSIFSGIFLDIGVIGGILANSEARWQSITELK